MPRYFFDLQDHENVRDDTGTEFVNADNARLHAAAFAGAYLRDKPNLIWDGKEIRVRVRDESGLIIFTVVTLSVDSQ